MKFLPESERRQLTELRCEHLRCIHEHEELRDGIIEEERKWLKKADETHAIEGPPAAFSSDVDAAALARFAEAIPEHQTLRELLLEHLNAEAAGCTARAELLAFRIKRCAIVLAWQVAGDISKDRQRLCDEHLRNEQWHANLAEVERKLDSVSDKINLWAQHDAPES